ncbi:tumor necrosis factor receptor superfamily member 1A isoform X3 [Stegastes partitus]|uniref:Tumor necrosis factor receptor superfamily member 1A isoform X3 n=1 Tax=Stegastes partitus TaxID=144197 RepID=A0A9Y4JHA0_9TELE|nr:PREDICTED: tumor necrosis factor receptor superfamily member 1A-like isoform X3 [Stegastes partitus]
MKIQRKKKVTNIKSSFHSSSPLSCIVKMSGLFMCGHLHPHCASIKPQILFQVFPLILCIIFSPQGYELMVDAQQKCPKTCEPGYYFHNHEECKKCAEHTHTTIPNCLLHCIRCESCSHFEVQIRPCSFNSSVRCDCPTDFYYSSERHCTKCSHNRCIQDNDNHDFIRKCQPCQKKQYLNVPACRSKCANIPLPTTASPSTTTAASKNTSTRPSSTGPVTSNSAPNPVVVRHNSGNHMPWFYFVVVGIPSLLVFLLLLLFTRNQFRSQDTCQTWSENADLEFPAEQRRLPGSSPTTPTLTYTEESPMLFDSQSPPIPEHSAPISPQPPDTDNTVPRQDEQSDRWPAIVLYAIIKEVPLRRWKEFLRLLSVADQQLERIELEAGLVLGSMEKQYQMLRLWSQRSTASLSDIFSALCHMELSGCAQLLQENLDKLPWKPDPRQGSTASRSPTGCCLNGAVHT